MRVAVLLSAGLDSAVLAAYESRRAHVHPLYITTGLAWEHEELAALDRLLVTPPFTSLAPLTQLTFTVRDLYPATHWALRGEPPAFDTPDEDVFLTGRNIILLTKASIHCAQHDINRIALGPLAGNPFPDATPEFFASMAKALSLGLAHDISIETPFVDKSKSDVIKLGVELGVPLELTLSCMNPRLHRIAAQSDATGERWLDGSAEVRSAGQAADIEHCGVCSKCRERRDALNEAGVEDKTRYAVQPAR